MPWGTLLIAALALYVPFVNYGVSADLIGGDAADAWALPGAVLHAFAGVFLLYPGLGQNAVEGIQGIFPTLTLAAAIHALGVPTAIGTRLVIALYFFATMLGALRLLTALLPAGCGSIGRLAACVGAIFYGINHFTIFLYSSVQTYYVWTYIALPWLVFGIVIGCERDLRRGAAIVAFALLCAGCGATSPATFGVALAAVAMGAALELAQGIAWRRVARVAGLGTLLGFGACAWWLLPMPTRIASGLGQVNAEGSSAWVQWMSARSSLPHLFKLDGYTGGDHLPGAAWYGSPLGDVAGYLPLIVALAGFGAVRARFSRLALALFALFVALGAGVHPPFGAVYRALMDHVPGFVIYRSPYDKWTPLAALLLTMLFGLGLAGVGRRAAALRPRTPRGARALTALAIGCGVLAVSAYPWPVYAGKLLYVPPGPTGFLSHIPADYARVAAIVRAAGGGTRTVTFGGDATGYPQFSWGYFGEDPILVATGTPTTGIAEIVPRAAYLSEPALERALRSLGVAYIVVHHDVLDAAPTPDIRWFVARGAVSLSYDSPSLSLYALRAAPMPLVVTASEPVLVSRAGLYAGVQQPDDAQTGRLDPNLGFALADDAASYYMPLSAVAPPATEALATASDVTAAPRRAGERVEYVAANPFGMIVARATCAGGRPALRVEPPTVWWAGPVGLPAFERTFCLSRPVPAAVAIDGVPIAVDDAPFSLSNAYGEHELIAGTDRFRFAFDQRVLDARALPPGRAGGLRERVNLRPDAAALLRQRLVWNAPADAPGVLTALVSLTAATTYHEAYASGAMLTTDRYRLRFRYSGTGSGEVWFIATGYSGDRVTRLQLDGGTHAFEETVFPPTARDGRYALRLRVVNGVLRAGPVTLTADGPNGITVATRPGSRLGGAVVALRRVAPWWFDVTVAGCAPCLLRASVSLPAAWAVRGARVEAVLEGQGQSTGAQWTGVTTGAAAWLLDAGPGRRRIALLFVPALLAIAGLAIAVVALAATIALLVRRAAAPAALAAEPEWRAGPLQWCSVLLAAAVPVAGAIRPDVAEGLATALWFMALLVAAGGDRLVLRGPERASTT